MVRCPLHCEPAVRLDVGRARRRADRDQDRLPAHSREARPRSRCSTCRRTMTASPARSSRSRTTTRPASFLNQTIPARRGPAEGDGRSAAAVVALAERGVSIVIADLPADALLKAADAGRDVASLFQRRRARRPAARGGLPRQRDPHRADAHRCWPTGLRNISSGRNGGAGCSSSVRTRRTSCSPMRCGGRRRGSARRSCRSASSRTPAARAAPTAASCRSSARFRCSPNRRPTTTCWSRRTRARCSRATCRIGPGRRGRSRALPGLVPKSWDPAHDQWGANQLQNRFVAMFRAA